MFECYDVPRFWFGLFLGMKGKLPNGSECKTDMVRDSQRAIHEDALPRGVMSFRFAAIGKFNFSDRFLKDFHILRKNRSSS